MLQYIKVVVEKLHVHFIAYTRLAAQHDEDYRQYSPYNSISTSRPITELPADNKVVVGMTKPTKKPGNTNSWFSKIKGNSHAATTRAIEGLKWSLHGKEKFEADLAEVKKGMQKLKEYIPFLLDSGHWKKEQKMFLRLIEDPKYAIFEPHVRLREIAHNPETGKMPSIASARRLLTLGCSRCPGKAASFH